MRQRSVLRRPVQRAALGIAALCIFRAGIMHQPEERTGGVCSPAQTYARSYFSSTENSAARQQRLCPSPRASTVIVLSLPSAVYCTLCSCSCGSSRLSSKASRKMTATQLSANTVRTMLGKMLNISLLAVKPRPTLSEVATMTRLR